MILVRIVLASKQWFEPCRRADGEMHRGRSGILPSQHEHYEVEDKMLQSLRGIRRLEEVAAERGLQSGHLRSKRPLDAPEEAPSATTSAPTALVVSPVPVAPTPIVTAFIKELDEVIVVDGSATRD